jgi:hypothetical protein
MNRLKFSFSLMVYSLSLYAEWKEDPQIEFNYNKIYYETFLRRSSNHSFSLHSKKFQSFNLINFAKEEKFKHTFKKGGFTISKDFEDKEYRVSSFNVLSGIKFNW